MFLRVNAGRCSRCSFTRISGMLRDTLFPGTDRNRNPCLVSQNTVPGSSADFLGLPRVKDSSREIRSGLAHFPHWVWYFRVFCQAVAFNMGGVIEGGALPRDFQLSRGSSYLLIRPRGNSCAACCAWRSRSRLWAHTPVPRRPSRILCCQTRRSSR